MNSSCQFRILFLVLGVALSNTLAFGQKVYWTESGLEVAPKIQRANLDGSDVETIVDIGLGMPYGIALDLIHEKVYWTDFFTGQIKRANLDGSHVEHLVGELRGVRGIALDVSGGKMYWVNELYDSIHRANLDGTGVENIGARISPLAFPTDIEIDPTQSKMYWISRSPCCTREGRIQRARLDGSDVEELIDLGNGTGIALDLVHQEMYWTDSGVTYGFIYRSDLDGYGAESIKTGSGVRNIAVDPLGGKIYWVYGRAGQSVIRRINFDRSGFETIVAGLNRPRGIALDLRVVADAFLDIKPGSCPNPLNTRSRGVTPIALLGTNDFDVIDIDPESLRLRRTDGVGGELRPLPRYVQKKRTLDDVGTPFYGAACDCHILQSDGTADLNMFFSTADMVEVLELFAAGWGDIIELFVTGQLVDGSEFRASDCITIIGGSRAGQLGNPRHRE